MAFDHDGNEKWTADVGSTLHGWGSTASLLLHDAAGKVIAEQRIAIACSGSTTIWPHEVFGDAALRQAGGDGFVLVRDTTCRLFGYHGLMDDAGAFSLDHMFGF